MADEIWGIEYHGDLPLCMHTKERSLALYLSKSMGKFLTPEMCITESDHHAQCRDVPSVTCICADSFDRVGIWLALPVMELHYKDQVYYRKERWAGLPKNIYVIEYPINLVDLLYGEGQSFELVAIYNPAQEHEMVDGIAYCKICDDIFPSNDLCVHVYVDEDSEQFCGVGTDEVPCLSLIAAWLYNYLDYNTKGPVTVQGFLNVIERAYPTILVESNSVRWVLGALDVDQQRGHVLKMLAQLNYWRETFGETARDRRNLDTLAWVLTALLRGDPEIDTSGWSGKTLGSRIEWMKDFVYSVTDCVLPEDVPEIMHKLVTFFVPRQRKKWSKRKVAWEKAATMIKTFAREATDEKVSELVRALGIHWRNTPE